MKNIIINNHLRLIILIALYALLLNISQNSYASIFFINIKDEIGSGYKQQKLFKSLDKKEKLIRIEKIGNKLSKVSRKRNGIDYIFNLISDENAYSGFAGFIYVGEPFYDMVTDDDELAFIIAHEMAHSDNRDTTVLNKCSPRDLKIKKITKYQYLKKCYRATSLTEFRNIELIVMRFYIYI